MKTQLPHVLHNNLDPSTLSCPSLSLSLSLSLALPLSTVPAAPCTCLLLPSVRVDGEQAGGNRHGHQLLDQQLHGVRDVDLRDLCRVLARAALKTVLRQRSNGHQSAEIAHMHTVCIRSIKETLLEELGYTVRDHAVMGSTPVPCRRSNVLEQSFSSPPKKPKR